jgi:pimeloyl-ACP methyl ester carboxylesterase
MRKRTLAVTLVALLVAVVVVANAELPGAGAGGLLYPYRRVDIMATPAGCRDTTIDADGLRLRGWMCAATGPRRGTIVYLHGVGDNRSSGSGLVGRFLKHGFGVAAFDSRAHGQSDGEICTYGFVEKADVGRIIDKVPPGPVVLFGASLGAAVALQHAPDDSRVSAIVAAETFSDLRTVATERAPFFFTGGTIERAIRQAEERGHFTLAAVSPVVAESRITVPVLLIHGEADVDTRPDHSRRVFDALRGPKQLIVVPGVGHNRSLQPAVLDEIDRWIDAALETAR